MVQDIKRLRGTAARFWVGVGLLLNVQGEVWKPLISRPERKGFVHDDQEALQGDWASVGTDLRRALRTYRHEPPELLSQPSYESR